MKFNAPTPIIRQIAEYLIKIFIIHIRNPGIRLSLVSELGIELLFIQNTAKHAYPFLNPNKTIHAKRRKGYYIDNKGFFLARRYLKFKCLDIDAANFSDSYILE